MRLTYTKHFLPALFAILPFLGFTQEEPRYPMQKLTHEMSREEALNRHLIGLNFVETDPPAGTVYSLPEFERSKGVLVRYPFGIPLSLIREMARDAMVTTIVANSSQENTVRNQYTQAGINLNNCTFFYAPTNSYWTRDYGPWYIAYGDNQIGVVDFPYNRPRPDDDEIARLIAENLGLPWFGMRVNHTGGNYMSDGYGMAASTTIAYTENPTLTPAQVDAKMQAYLGINNYQVVEDPNNTYIDHIDCWGKYLAPDKILIRSVPPSHPQYNKIEETAAHFASLTTPWGVPYKIFRVNTPQNQPYSNSFILNDKVFVPIMGSQYDEPALEIYRQAMPGYKVIGVMGNPATPWESTDALHCRTHEMADPEMLRIRHIPLIGNISPAANLSFTTNVTAYSGAEVIADSILLFYRINPNPYTPFEVMPFSNSMGNNWSVTIPAPEYGSTIQYYIHAADMSGRSENHPFIGSADPHEFYIGEQLFAVAEIPADTLFITAMKEESGNTSLSIGNNGMIGLNFFVSVSTDISDTLTTSLPDSPAGNTYSYNTLTEKGWTSLNMAEQGILNNIIVHYTWSTDSYPLEGSLWAESPAGNQVMLASGQSNGNYSVKNSRFAGEEMQGIWKFWIEDTYGDGGHQAKNISVQFIRSTSTGDWLSTDVTEGTVAPGMQNEIIITGNAAGVELGNYYGRVNFLSNDPDTPEITVPVKFTVTVNTATKQVASAQPHLSVFPNPGSGNFTIALSGILQQSFTAELYDLTGRRIMMREYSAAAVGQEFTFPAYGLPQGMYLLKVTSGEYIKSIKVIRE